MGWRTDAQTVYFEARNALFNKFDEFKNFLQGQLGTAKAQLGSLIQGTSYIGINGQKIPEMREAIRTYVAEINTNLDKVIENTSTVNAFHGEYATAITEYVTAVKEVCKAYTSSLLEFSDNLDKIAEIYHAKDTEFASSIRNTANEASSTATTYQEARADKTYGSTATK